MIAERSLQRVVITRDAAGTRALAGALAGGLIDDRQAEGVTLVEWAERLADAMPDERLDVLIDGSGDAPRTITLRPGDESYARYLDLVPADTEPAR